MDWAIDEAQQRFLELIDAAVEEPQLIRDRDRLVAVVIKTAMFEEFLAWRKQHRSTIADAFLDLRQICSEENYRLEVPPRIDRPNAFADTSDDLAL
jgi:hypothetical protein